MYNYSPAHVSCVSKILLKRTDKSSQKGKKVHFHKQKQTAAPQTLYSNNENKHTQYKKTNLTNVLKHISLCYRSICIYLVNYYESLLS